MIAPRALVADVGWQPQWWDVLQTSFMRHAFLAGTVVAVAAGVTGYFVVLRRDAFAAHALAHIGFPGATGALLVGAPVMAGLVVFCVAGALAIGSLGRDVARRDLATGSVLAAATGLGVLFASLASRQSTTVTNVLFGNLLATSPGQIGLFGVFAALLLVAFGGIARPLVFASVDPEVALAKGVRLRALGTAFLVLLALAVAMAVQVVGTLLLFALVVTPAATALMLSARPPVVVAVSVGLAVASVWLGLLLSVMFDLAPSPLIVGVSVAAWLATMAATRPRRRGREPRIDAHRPHPH